MIYSRINLSDLTILIPIRIDSEDRLDNLQCILHFFSRRIKCFFILLEADALEKVKVQDDITKIFIEDHELVFYRTKYINQMISEAITPFIAIWDADVLVDPIQMLSGIEMLRKDEADMVFPYDGNFHAVPQFFKETFCKHLDRLEILKQSIGEMTLMHNYPSVGGGFLTKKQAYIEAGMENENFYGWGLEDAERIKRWEILGYRIKRTTGEMFHLSHQRGMNSCYANKSNELRSRKEFLRICSMNSMTLRYEVNTWIKSK